MGDETSSKVPDDFLESALFIFIKDLRAQVAASEKAVIRETLAKAKDDLAENRSWNWGELSGVEIRSYHGKRYL